MLFAIEEQQVAACFADRLFFLSSFLRCGSIKVNEIRVQFLLRVVVNDNYLEVIHFTEEAKQHPFNKTRQQLALPSRLRGLASGRRRNSLLPPMSLFFSIGSLVCLFVEWHKVSSLPLVVVFKSTKLSYLGPFITVSFKRVTACQQLVLINAQLAIL